MISYKYPIFPNKITQWMLAENLDACRWLYNRLLQDLNEAKEKGIKLKTYDTQNLIPSLKLENPKLNQVYSKVLQMVNYSDASFGDDVGSRALQDAAVHTSINKRVVDIMLPRVILHNAVSLDGRIDGFPMDLQQYYELISIWKEDATLAGSHTFLKAASVAPPEDESAFVPPKMDPGDKRAILVIPDSRGRIRTWHYLRTLPYWRHFVALCSKSTPEDYLEYLKQRHIDCIVTGEDHVDLRMALEELYSRYAVRVVRADAGGTLNGLLLRQGLVNEVSVLIYPSLVGGETTSSIFRAPDLPAAEGAAPGQGAEGTISLKLMKTEKLKGDVMFLRYEVRR